MKLNGGGLYNYVFWLISLTILIALAIYDIKYLTLPNRLVYILLGVSVIHIIGSCIFFHEDLNQIIGSIFGFVIGGGVFYILFQLSSGKWIGGGDVKLGAVLGLILGSALNAFMMIFIASLLGTLISLPLLAVKRLGGKSQIPYGPFLIAATIILMLFSTSIVNWLKARGVYLD